MAPYVYTFMNTNGTIKNISNKKIMALQEKSDNISDNKNINKNKTKQEMRQKSAMHIFFKQKKNTLNQN